jgi:GxxExxY protein
MIDVLIEHKIVCELKAVEKLNPFWQAQVLSHLKLNGPYVGFILNFNVE